MILAGAGMLFIPCMPATGAPATSGENHGNCNGARQCSGKGHSFGYDFERARRNYLALARGAKSPSQLSAVEAQEVRELLKLMEEYRSSDRSGYEQCRELQLGGRTDPTELELRLIDLKCSMR